MKRVAVTGARGYVGTVLCSFLREKGVEVLELTREELDLSRPPFHLPEADVLVHLAWDQNLIRWKDSKRVNVDGSLSLLDQALGQGTQFVFVSTLSAFEGCVSNYGRAKLLVEEQVLKRGGAVVRPAVVFSKAALGGMAGSLRAAVRDKWMAPLVQTPSVLYPCHEEDLCHLMERVISDPKGLVTAASPEGRPLEAILRLLNPQIRLLPLPWRPMWLLIKVLELLGLRLSFRSDSLLSLANQDPRPQFETRGVSFRSFEEGFA